MGHGVKEGRGSLLKIMNFQGPCFIEMTKHSQHIYIQTRDLKKSVRKEGFIFQIGTGKQCLVQKVQSKSAKAQKVYDTIGLKWWLS